MATDGWSAYGGPAAAWRHELLNLQLGRRGNPPGVRPGKRWLLGTHHGAVSQKHLPARFNRRTASNLSHRFARLIEHAVRIQPTTYRTLVNSMA